MGRFGFGGYRYAMLMGIARELACMPRAQFDTNLQREICQRNGLPLDEMTDDEIELVGQMATDYGRKNYV